MLGFEEIGFRVKLTSSLQHWILVIRVSMLPQIPAVLWVSHGVAFYRCEESLKTSILLRQTFETFDKLRHHLSHHEQ